jgi:hypothetical protein
MAIQLETKRSFDTSSPVARYWLAQCEGFHVEGLVKGTVEEVVGAVDPQMPEALVVRRAWRRWRVPVAAVGAVVPAARLILVDRGRARKPSLAAAVATKGPPAARFAAGVALSFALLVFTALVLFGRLLARFAISCTGLAKSARRALVDKHRRMLPPPRQSSSNSGPRLSRAAVLGLGRETDRRRTQR